VATPPTDLTLYRFKRQIALAQARGEPVEPLVRRLVLETIDGVMAVFGAPLSALTLSLPTPPGIAFQTGQA
jgi:hypothetical protein